MPTVPQRAIFHKAWSDPLAPAENPRSFPIGSNVRITDQALLDRIDSADVAHISANFDLTAPGDIGSGTAGNGWFNNLVVGAAALFAAGTASAPGVAVGAADTGISQPGTGELALVAAGTELLTVSAGRALFNTGEVRFPNGSAASPAMTFDSDRNTGIYRHGTDQLGIAVGGSTGVVVTPEGTGFGTTDPGASLHLVSTSSLPFIAQGASSTVRFSIGNTSAPTGKRFFGLGVTSGSDLTIQGLTDASTFARNLFGLSHDGGLTFYNSASAAAGVWDAANSRWGLGTTTPTTRLHVISTGADIATFEAPATGGQIRLYRGTSFGWDIGITGGSSFTIGPDGGSTFFTMNSAGAAAFGTTSPDSNLHIYSAGNTTLKVQSGYANSTTTGITVETTGDSSVGRFAFNKAGVTRGGLFFRHNATAANESFGISVAGGADKLVVTGAGLVGIMQPVPTEALHVVGNILTTGRVRAKDGTTGDVALGFGSDHNVGFIRVAADTMAAVTASAVRTTWAPDGSVGFGTTNPDARIHGATGDSSTIAKFERTGGNPGLVSVYCAANNAYLALTGNSTTENRLVGLSGTAGGLAVEIGGAEKLRVTGNTGSTGGTGSAGSGNQYVELNLNGQRYKLLHDGTL